MSADESADLARLRTALASLHGNGRSRVDAGRIFDAVHGQLSAEERQALVEELIADPDAAEAWRLAIELAPEPAAAPATGQGWPRWLALAAMLLLTVGVGWWFTRSSPEPVYRGSAQPAIVSVLPADAVLARARPVLQWRGIEGARYRVKVLTPQLELIDESPELSASEYRVEKTVLERVPSGGRLLWQVEGRLRDGTVVVSPTFTARLE
jgi:hypothetical protein